MKKRSFAIVSMALLADTDAPESPNEIEVTKTNGSTLSIPVFVQSFKDRESFINSIVEAANSIWNIHQEVVSDNEEIEEAEMVLALSSDIPTEELN